MRDSGAVSGTGLQAKKGPNAATIPGIAIENANAPRRSNFRSTKTASVEIDSIDLAELSDESAAGDNR